MTECVLDASALLALIRKEPGANRVAAALGNALMSAVNFSETLAKEIERGAPFERSLSELDILEIVVVPFDKVLAGMAASLRPVTRHLGLSFADRACLALALKTGAAVLTADRDMAKAEIGIRIECIR